jgi:hypothetical protein
MSRAFMVVYKPYKGSELELLPAIKASYADLMKNGYVTSDAPKLMLATNGAIILLFEWKTHEMIDQAQADPQIQHHWMKLAKMCEFEKPMNLVEFQQPFSEFEVIEWSDF